MRTSLMFVCGCYFAFLMVGQSQDFPNYPPLIEIDHADMNDAESIILNQLPTLDMAEAMAFFCSDDVGIIHKILLPEYIETNQICQGASQQADCGGLSIFRVTCQSSEMTFGINDNTEWIQGIGIMSKGCIDYDPADDMILEIKPTEDYQTIYDFKISGIRPNFLDDGNTHPNPLAYFEFEIIGPDGDLISQSNNTIPVPPTPSQPLLEYTLTLDQPITIPPNSSPIQIRITQCGGIPSEDTGGFANLFAWMEVYATGICGCGICDPYWEVMSTDNLQCDNPQSVPVRVMDECGQVITSGDIMCAVVNCAASSSDECLDCSCPTTEDLYIIVGTDTLYSLDTLYLTDCLDLIPSPSDFLQLLPGVGEMLTHDYYTVDGVRILRFKWWGGDCPDATFKLFVVYTPNCDGFCPLQSDLFIIDLNGDTLYHQDTLYLTGCLDLIPRPSDFLQTQPGVSEMLTHDHYNQNGVRVLRFKWWGGGCPDVMFKLYVVYDEDCSNFCPNNDDLYIIIGSDTIYHQDTVYLPDCFTLIHSPTDFLQPPPGAEQMQTDDYFDQFGTRIIRWKWWGGYCPDAYFKIYIIYGPPDCIQDGPPISMVSIDEPDVLPESKATVEMEDSADRFIDFVIAPNPATNKCTLYFEGASEEQLSIQLMDLQGRIINTYFFHKTPEETDLIFSDLPRGIYILKVFGENIQKAEKLILE